MRLATVDIDLLRTFITIVQTGSFTRTAEKLLRTQSAISLQVKRLETTVGHRLLRRDSRKVEMTAVGEIVASYAAEMLRINDELVNRTFDHDEQHALRVGTPDDYAKLLLPTVLSEFARSHPGTEIQIVSDLSVNLADMVENDEVDLAFITATANMEGIAVTNEPLCLVAASRDVASGRPLALAIAPQGCQVREQATSALTMAGIPWRVSHSSKSFEMLSTAILAGQAIGVLPTRAVPADMVRLGEADGLPELSPIEIQLVPGNAAGNLARELASKIAGFMNSRARPFPRQAPLQLVGRPEELRTQPPGTG